MSHSFCVTIPEHLDIPTGVNMVREGIQKEGGTYHFDGKLGKFAVKGVAGTFSVIGRVVEITLTKKPFIVSFAFVERAVRGYFE